jgi:hypothetical protein
VGHDFATLRVRAETKLLGSHHHVTTDALHYACLTVDRKGLESYGECLVQLAESMIAHRASCFEGNTAVLYAEGHDLSDCLRSTWSDRGMLCMAIFACHLDASFTSSDFPAIVVKDGVTGIDDRFIEVHIFGPMTLRTFEAIQIDEAKFSSQQKILSEMVQEKAVGIVTLK